MGINSSRDAGETTIHRGTESSAAQDVPEQHGQGVESPAIGWMSDNTRARFRIPPNGQRGRHGPGAGETQQNGLQSSKEFSKDAVFVDEVVQIPLAGATQNIAASVDGVDLGQLQVHVHECEDVPPAQRKQSSAMDSEGIANYTAGHKSPTTTTFDAGYDRYTPSSPDEKPQEEIERRSSSLFTGRKSPNIALSDIESSHQIPPSSPDAIPDHAPGRRWFNIIGRKSPTLDVVDTGSGQLLPSSPRGISDRASWRRRSNVSIGQTSPTLDVVDSEHIPSSPGGILDHTSGLRWSTRSAGRSYPIPLTFDGDSFHHDVTAPSSPGGLSNHTAGRKPSNLSAKSGVGADRAPSSNEVSASTPEPQCANFEDVQLVDLAEEQGVNLEYGRERAWMYLGTVVNWSTQRGIQPEKVKRERGR